MLGPVRQRRVPFANVRFGLPILGLVCQRCACLPTFVPFRLRYPCSPAIERWRTWIALANPVVRGWTPSDRWQMGPSVGKPTPSLANRALRWRTAPFVGKSSPSLANAPLHGKPRLSPATTWHETPCNPRGSPQNGALKRSRRRFVPRGAVRPSAAGQPGRAPRGSPAGRTWGSPAVASPGERPGDVHVGCGPRPGIRVCGTAPARNAVQSAWERLEAPRRWFHTAFRARPGCGSAPGAGRAQPWCPGNLREVRASSRGNLREVRASSRGNVREVRPRPRRAQSLRPRTRSASPRPTIRAPRRGEGRVARWLTRQPSPPAAGRTRGR